VLRPATPELDRGRSSRAIVDGYRWRHGGRPEDVERAHELTAVDVAPSPV